MKGNLLLLDDETLALIVLCLAESHPTISTNLATGFFTPDQAETLKLFHQPDLMPIVEKACNIYASDDVEIDDEPMFSEAENGTWVSAWVWIPNDVD